ncbi:MAG: VWA domain-containing protein [Anaerolineales bacterium]|jgi:Ca-activated chloride channel family protein
MQAGTNYYTLLGLTKDATAEEIRSAYREAARRYHPDVNSKPGETELFLEIKEAYDILSDPQERAEYDTQVDAEAEIPPVKIEVLCSRQSLPRLKEPQLVYALIQLSPENDTASAAVPSLNVCLVIDRSTSMQGKRLDTVKDAAIEIMRQLKPADLLSIVAFSDRAEVILSAGSRRDRKTVETKIRLLRADGGTEILRGLEAGLAQVRRGMRPGTINHLILLTDGRTYGDEDDCLRLAKQAAEDGIGISGLGIGGEWNDRFLDDLARRTGGSSVYISESADIKKFLSRKFHSLNQVFAEHVVYNPRISQHARLNYAFRLKPEAGVLGTERPLQLGSLPVDSSLEILLEFLVMPVPSSADEIRLAEGRFSLDMPRQPLPSYTSRLELNLPVIDTVDAQPTPDKIVQAMKQLTLYRIQEQARREIERGESEKANRRLRRLATHLLSQGKYELARTVLDEAKNLAHSQPLSEEGIKEIKYGTRALFLPEDREDE